MTPTMTPFPSPTMLRVDPRLNCRVEADTLNARIRLHIVTDKDDTEYAVNLPMPADLVEMVASALRGIL